MLVYGRDWCEDAVNYGSGDFGGVAINRNKLSAASNLFQKECEYCESRKNVLPLSYKARMTSISQITHDYSISECFVQTMNLLARNNSFLELNRDMMINSLSQIIERDCQKFILMQIQTQSGNFEVSEALRYSMYRGFALRLLGA